MASTILASCAGGEASGVRVDGQVSASFHFTVLAAMAGVASITQAAKPRAIFATNFIITPVGFIYFITGSKTSDRLQYILSEFIILLGYFTTSFHGLICPYSWL